MSNQVQSDSGYTAETGRGLPLTYKLKVLTTVPELPRKSDMIVLFVPCHSRRRLL